MGAQCLQLGREEEGLPLPPVVERLLPETVPDQVEHPLRRVPCGKGEHSGDPGKGGLDPPPGDQREQDLGIGTSPEDLSCRDQLLAQRGVIVDLPVEDDRVSAVRRRHRLVPLGGQVQDGQATEPEGHIASWTGPGACVIGTPMDERRGHPRRHCGPFSGISRWSSQACEAAHAIPPLAAACYLREEQSQPGRRRRK